MAYIIITPYREAAAGRHAERENTDDHPCGGDREISAVYDQEAAQSSAAGDWGAAGAGGCFLGCGYGDFTRAA